MNVWIHILGEPIESDARNIRLHRAGTLAKFLVNRGHKVTLWTSNVDHVSKKLRCKKTTITKIHEDYTEVQLAGRLYKKNISFSRILHNIDVTKEFKKIVNNFKKPDVVITNYPIIELSEAVIDYSKNNKIPSIVDIRDFWPDIFYETLPKSLKFIGNYIFWPWQNKAKKIIKNVTAVTGISDAAISWARNKNNQDVKLIDKSFPLAYESTHDFKFNQKFLDKNNIDPYKHNIYCFFGNLSKRIELRTLTEAAKILNKTNKQIKFIVCGNGEMKNFLINEAKNCSSLILPGWINKDEINTLLTVSKAGILPYPSSMDFKRSYPNKVGEYLSKNLPILSSVTGEMESLLKNWECGITYKNNSPKSLVHAIESLERDEDSRIKMSNNAKKCFHNKFDSEIVYNNYVSFVESFQK